MSKVNLLFFLTPQIMDDYQKDTARLVKEKLEGRASHLKVNKASDDPYANNVKTIYEKAKGKKKVHFIVKKLQIAISQRKQSKE